MDFYVGTRDPHTWCGYPLDRELFSDLRPRVALDGDWRFRIDGQDAGVEERWFTDLARLEGPGAREIRVPGTWQAQGVGAETVLQFHEYQGTAWYWKTFRVPGQEPGRRWWLQLGGVMPCAEVWVNGRPVGSAWMPMFPTRPLIDAGDVPVEAAIELRVRPVRDERAT